MCLLLSGGCNGMLVCLARCTFIPHCSANAMQQFVSRLRRLSGRRRKQRHGESCGVFALYAQLNVCCTCGLSICCHLPPIGGGEAAISPPPCLHCFMLPLCRKRCRLFRSRGVPCGLQSSTEPPYIYIYTLQCSIKRGEREMGRGGREG